MPPLPLPPLRRPAAAPPPPVAAPPRLPPSAFLTDSRSELSAKMGVWVSSRGRGRRGLQVSSLFGLGVPELVVIAGVAALVFGPKKLPEIGRNIGKTVKSFQQAFSNSSNLAKFCDECGSPYLRKTSKYCSECGPKRVSFPRAEEYPSYADKANVNLVQAFKSMQIDEEEEKPLEATSFMI